MKEFAGGGLPIVAKKRAIYNPSIAAAKPDVSVAQIKPVSVVS